MKALVTGGAGFIGSHVADALLERGDQVLVVDDLSTGERSNLNPRAEFAELDIRALEAAAVVARWKPQAISHHAAQMSVSRSVKEPLFDAEVNVLGALNLLEAARAVEARLVFASTGGALYGDADMLPTPETVPAWPVSPYGVSKLSFEHYLYCYGAEHGLSYAALRYANVYGPRQNPHGEAGVVAIFCKALLGDGQAQINGDGRQTRDYIYVRDVVRANLLALDAPGTVGHFNVGTGRQTDVNTLFRLLTERLGVRAPEAHGPARPGEQRTSALDSSLIADRLGWQPETNLEAGLQETADWFKARLRT